jgi:hypothetical protein
LKEEALDRTMWRAGFGRDFGPVVRQTNKWMNVSLLLRYGEIYSVDCIKHWNALRNSEIFLKLITNLKSWDNKNAKGPEALNSLGI